MIIVIDLSRGRGLTPREANAAEFIRRLRPSLSESRLNRYRRQGDSDIDLMVNYLWNIGLCEALYPALNGLEVSLRNTIHTAATKLFGNEFWFDQRNLLLSKQQEEVLRAKEKISEQGKQETSGRIVAELPFGFWAVIMSAPYDATLWRPNSYRVLRDAFPHIPYQQRERRFMHGRYNAIRLLRNQVFHYEPIFDREDLTHDHEQILEALDWINPAVREAIGLVDRFTVEVSTGRQRVADRITEHLEDIESSEPSA